MGFQIFLSHNVRDGDSVGRIRQELAAVGVESYVFEHDLQPGQSIAEKLQSAIRASDVVVVLLTENSVPSPYVQQEVGYALAQRKLVIPLVEQGTSSNTLAMLAGVEYISFDSASPQEGIQKLTDYLGRLSDEKRRDELLMVGLLVGVLILIALSTSTRA